jgi:DNA-binding MarR family transcriptional regulator
MSESCESNPSALILVLADQLRNHLEQATRRVGLTVQQAELLMQIDGPRRMSELAKVQLCDPSSITSLVARLERDGLVRRKVDPDDGRVRLVVLTAAGRRARESFVVELEALPDPFAVLTSEQRRALTEQLALRTSPEGNPLK